jgi:hypothetical protein
MSNISADNVPPVKRGGILKLCARLLVILVLLTVTGVVVASFLVPRRYYSKVTMEVRPANSGPVVGPGLEYIRMQLQELRTSSILYPVIRRLGLTRAYAPAGKSISQQDAWRHLRASMRLQAEGNTGKIEIGVSDTDAQRAADTANAIAVMYQFWLAKGWYEIEMGQQVPIKDREGRLAAQRKQVSDTATLAYEIERRNGIADANPLEIVAPSFMVDAGAPSDATATPVRPAAAVHPDSPVQPEPDQAKIAEYMEAKQRAIRERKVLESMELAEVANLGPGLPFPRAKIWEKAERAAHPENRIASLLDNIFRPGAH